MTKVLSFHEYIQKTNEADLFGVTTSPSGNLPSGYNEPEDDYEGERDIDPVGSPSHKLKLIEVGPREYTTNSSDVALLEDPQGKKYIWYWGSHLDNPNLWRGTLLSDGEIDENSVEAVANRISPMENIISKGDWFEVVFCRKCGHVYGVVTKYVETDLQRYKDVIRNVADDERKEILRRMGG